MSSTEETVEKPRRRRRLWWNTAGVAVGLIAIVSALVWWAGSDQFQDMVRSRLAQQLQAVTGGRVEIASFHWHLLRLEAEAGGVVIHGDELPNEAPYAQVEKLRVRLSVLELWSPRIVLRDLQIVRPQMHFIFYSDGATNQPHPAQQTNSNHSGLDTLFDLQAGHISVEQGDIDMDNRAAALDVQNRYQPLDFDGDDVSVVLQYLPPQGQTPERYHVEAGIRDVNLTRGGELKETVAPVHGLVQASLDLTRDAATLTSLRLTSATKGSVDRTLNIAGTLSHFSHPRWQATVRGDVDMRLLDPALGYSFTPEGIASLELTSAGQDGTFRVDGTVKVAKAAYIQPGVTVRGMNLSAKVHADPTALRITSVILKIEMGGEMAGEVLLTHWLPTSSGPVMEPVTAQPPVNTVVRKKIGTHPHSPKPEQPAPKKAPHSEVVKNPIVHIPVEGKVNAEFRNVSLDTVLDIVGQAPFQRLGLNTTLTGPANATWERGDVNTLSVKSTLRLSPGVPEQGEAPATGVIDGTYTQMDGAVEVRALEVNLPSSHMSAHGRLGAFPLTSPTALNVDVESSNLREFDKVLRDLGLTRNGKVGTEALPVALDGAAEFHGTWAGSMMSPRLAGDLNASQIALELPPIKAGGAPQTIHWDSVAANGTYDAEHIAVVHGQLKRGDAQVAVDGTLVAAAPTLLNTPRKGGARTTSLARGDEMPAFDEGSVLHAHLRATKLATGDLMPLAGLDLPVTGSIDAQIAVDGPFQMLSGSGWAQLNDAMVYGEPITSVRVQGTMTRDELKLSSIDVHGSAGSIAGSGSYELQTKGFRADVHGSGIDVEKIQRVRATGEAVTGKLDFAASVSGTREDPQIEGRASASGLSVDGRAMGTLNLTAHTQYRSVHYDVSSNFESAAIALHGQTELRGDYQTQAKLDFSHFDVATLFKMAHVDSISAQSSLDGEAQISGPLAHPDEMRGDLRLAELAAVIAGVHLKSDGGVHASLDHTRVTLDAVHITGDDTDLHAQGTLGLKDTRRLDFAASGSVNLKLAETLDHDLTANGSSSFQLEAHGPLGNPGLRGTVQFQDGSLSLEDVPNGLSQLRGTLEFNQNRLEVKSLTAMTGGGQLSLGGYLAYQNGIYADLSVTGKQIRIRYPQGVSSLADANLHLQGTQSNLLLSGNVLITRFSLSPDLDFAALAAQAASVQSLAPPNAPSNHVRLDVRVQSSPQLNFQNAYAKLAGDVDLRLRGTVASPSLLGRISVTEGTATIAGTRYELQRGDVTFTNPVRIQPTIDLNATARVEDYDITLGLHGTPPDKMSMTYRSDPPLPEADVVALLALGRTQSEQGLYTQQQQQSVGMSPSTDMLLGGALNATVSSRVRKLFGAGSVKVDPSYLGALGNSTTRITVEEQVGKNVTLTYATNVDTSAQQLIQAEIAINRHVSVQMTRDESGVFSMVIKAIRRYK